MHDTLKDKALSLPMEPGVYIMLDADKNIIYVGKAAKLKNRVTSYFQDTDIFAVNTKNMLKTFNMVAQIKDFDYIVTKTELDALLLENSLIKRHTPKYNILLKDDKGFPFVKLTVGEEYPRFSVASRMQDDGARYFGPFGKRTVTFGIVDALNEAFKLIKCSRRFPRDIGKERPCLNHHMGACLAPCTGNMTRKEYGAVIAQAVELLEGKYGSVAARIKKEMEEAAENLEFERAAILRDRSASIEQLGQRQNVITNWMSDSDVIGCHRGASKTCVVVLHFIGGQLLGRDDEVVQNPSGGEEAVVVEAFLKQYYLQKNMLPGEIMLPCKIEDMEMLAGALSANRGKAVLLTVPKRGRKREYIDLAHKNACEEVERVTTKDEYVTKSMEDLRAALSLETVPERIEAFDISNTAGGDTVASMTVFKDSQPLKHAYRRFKITQSSQDDYAAMREALRRRLERYRAEDKKFLPLPNLLLVDGGHAHAAAAMQVLGEFELSIPVFGMVKDSRHKTRALVSPDGAEIGITGTTGLFSLVGRIQEETHRFAVEYHRTLRDSRVTRSGLDDIQGIGPTRRAVLLKRFKSVAGVKKATYEELVEALPESAAQSVYDYYHGEGQNEGK